MNFFGVRIDELGLDEIIIKVRQTWQERKTLVIFTPNPEMLVDAKKHPTFAEALNRADINICDGKGIEMFGKKRLTRLAGIDLMLKLCKLSAIEKKKVFLLGGLPGSAKKTAQKLVDKVSNFNLAGFGRGINIELDLKSKRGILYDEEANKKMLDNINKTAPDILFVAFGHGKQEFWIKENINKLTTAKVVMGVGGSFDYISHKVRRAPKFARQCGCEWFFRLIYQPQRIGRIFKAIIIFPLLVLKNRKNYDS